MVSRDISTIRHREGRQLPVRFLITGFTNEYAILSIVSRMRFNFCAYLFQIYVYYKKHFGIMLAML